MKHVFLLVLFGLAACADGTAALAQLAGFRIQSPSDGGAANEAQPLVRWGPFDGANRYQVAVFPGGSLAGALDVQTVTGTEARLRPVLADGEEFTVEVTALDESGVPLSTIRTRFKVVLLPASFPPLNVVVHDPARAQGGYKLFDLIHFADERDALVLVNAAGEVVWYHRHPSVIGSLTDARVLPNGNLLFVLRRVAYEITWDGTIVWQSRPGVLVHHEVGIGPGGNYLYLTFVAEEHEGTSYEGDGLELVDPATNQVLWEWNIFDHFSPADIQVPESIVEGRSGLGVEWSHGNSAVWDPDRSVIWVSLRHFDRILGIDYPSGAIVVTLGQGGLGGDDAMRHQHAPEVQPDGQILFFDNGNNRSPAESRVVQVDFDPNTGRYDETFVWKDDPPFYDFAVGDADRLPNGNILVTSGTNSRLVEVSPEGDVVWDLDLDTDVHWIYRAEQVPLESIPKGVLPFDD